jgi:hypothetical protein
MIRDLTSVSNPFYTSREIAAKLYNGTQSLIEYYSLKLKLINQLPVKAGMALRR